jgi:hypothetical protein
VSLLAEPPKPAKKSPTITIVEAYERGHDEAMRLIASHNETAKETTRRAISAAGGRL